MSEFPIDVTFKRADIFQFYARETNIRRHKVVGSSHLNSEALVLGLSSNVQALSLHRLLASLNLSLVLR